MGWLEPTRNTYYKLKYNFFREEGKTKMVIETFVGTWILIASSTLNSEISFTNGVPDPNGVRNWLNGSGKDLIEKAELASGLSLTILPDGSFIEEKNSETKVDWFDDEGVLNSDPYTYTGTLMSNTYGVFLEQSSDPRFATSTDKYGSFVRYDDGDTKISDSIARKEAVLIRTVNVVTDEAYLMRVIYIYKQK